MAGYGGNAEPCLDDWIGRLAADPAVTDLRPERSNGQAGEVRDADRAYARYGFAITDATGSRQELVKHIEYRTLVPEQAVLVIDAFLPRADLAAQLQALEGLLGGLGLPSG